MMRHRGGGGGGAVSVGGAHVEGKADHVNIGPQNVVDEHGDVGGGVRRACRVYSAHTYNINAHIYTHIYIYSWYWYICIYTRGNVFDHE